MKKRILSLTLVIVMLLSLIPFGIVTVTAEGAELITKIEINDFNPQLYGGMTASQAKVECSYTLPDNAGYCKGNNNTYIINGENTIYNNETLSADKETVIHIEIYAMPFGVNKENPTHDFDGENLDDIEVWINGVLRTDVTVEGYNPAWRCVDVYVPVEVSPLAPAPVITIDENGVATWTPVDGAAEYFYMMSTFGGFLDFDEELSINLPEKLKYYDKESGTYTLKVYAVDENRNQISEQAETVYEFTNDEITSVTATVSGAEAGATAGSTTVTTNDTTYTVSIKGWYDCDNVFGYSSAPILQPTDTFVGGKTYTVGVTFTPVEGNTLANSLTTSINGESGKIGEVEGNGRNYFITITIPASQPITYTVSFDANGGTGTMADVTGISGEYTLPENGFTAPDGKQFKAWSVGGVEKAVGDTITVNANTTVTAIWENIPVTYYTVTFDSNGGSAVTAQTIEAGQKATKPADPTKDGYDFKGWTLNDSAYDFNTAVNGNITLVATWEQKQVAPTYTVGDINGNDKIDARDYLLLKRAYFGTYTLTCAPEAADINGNGKIDARDYLLLKRAYFGTYEIK